ncbi:alkylmercury lyase family protein [Halorussus gelatinilyticus]|uniref:Alkylmercury lyase family protein n=1 Tax=Halorussus gelatinilyticus TaxID=2937524 RepID=A0A8U0IL76_9EURY|nr:organomercurial lyase [Halorussus gelatinilyticus]UPW01528.1 alkylmercury lyase family protein [Halorussus gelatinilyticus]
MPERNAVRDEANDESSAVESVEERPLPPGIGENIEALFGTDERPETVGAWVEAVAAAFDDDWPPAVADLCHDDEGRHRAETDDRSYRFVCVLDAVMLPFLTGESVEVRSEGPETGETVTSRVSRSDIETDPEDAVLSFGVASVDSDADPTPRRTYESLCPYVHAFPDEDAYRRWNDRTDAPTTALPLSEGFELARALIRA